MSLCIDFINLFIFKLSVSCDSETKNMLVLTNVYTTFSDDMKGFKRLRGKQNRAQ